MTDILSRTRAWFRHHAIRQHALVPLWRRIPEKQRWRIVSLLNHSDRYQWCDLVHAALCLVEDDPCDTPLPAMADRCRTRCEWIGCDHSPGQCTCYCGKFTFADARPSRVAS